MKILSHYPPWLEKRFKIEPHKRLEMHKHCPEIQLVHHSWENF